MTEQAIRIHRTAMATVGEMRFAASFMPTSSGSSATTRTIQCSIDMCRTCEGMTVLVGVERFYSLWVFLGLSVPAVIAGVVSQSWQGALMGFLWGGLVRIFVVHHVTWSINSICHTFGRRESRKRRSFDEQLHLRPAWSRGRVAQ